MCICRELGLFVAIFAVYVHPDGTSTNAPDTGDLSHFRFIPERPSLLALLFPPLWLAYKKMWLALLIWFSLASFLSWIGIFLNLVGWEYLSVLFLIWGSFVARDVETWSMERSGWELCGIVSAVSTTEAELIFFRDSGF